MEVGTRDADGIPAQEMRDGGVVAALVEVGLDGASAELRQVEVDLGVKALGKRSCSASLAFGQVHTVFKAAT